MPNPFSIAEEVAQVAKVVEPSASRKLAEEAFSGGYGNAADLAHLPQLPPKSFERILTLGDEEIAPGQSASLFHHLDERNMTLGLTKDGQAYVVSHDPGYVLHGHDWRTQGMSPKYNFGTDRQMVPLWPGKEVPVGANGDYIFRPGSNDAPIFLKPTGVRDFSKGSHALVAVERADHTVEELSKLATGPHPFETA